MTRKLQRAAAIALCLALFPAFPTAGPTAARAETDTPDNKVLQVVTGAPQWEGVIIYTDGPNSLNLEKKTYDFSFRAYTPDKDIGLRFQTNTFGGWSWDFISDHTIEELSPPGWYEISGSLDMDKAGVSEMGQTLLRS